MGRNPNRRGKGFVPHYASFSPEVADFIDTQAAQLDVAKSVVIAGLVIQGIKATYQIEGEKDVRYDCPQD